MKMRPIELRGTFLWFQVPDPVESRWGGENSNKDVIGCRTELAKYLEGGSPMGDYNYVLIRKLHVLGNAWMSLP